MSLQALPFPARPRPLGLPLATPAEVIPLPFRRREEPTPEPDRYEAFLAACGNLPGRCAMAMARIARIPGLLLAVAFLLGEEVDAEEAELVLALDWLSRTAGRVTRLLNRSPAC